VSQFNVPLATSVHCAAAKGKAAAQSSVAATG
jgi:hypothetical protein